MAEPQLKIEGLDLVQANMRRVARGYPREQATIHQTLGQTVLDKARGRARVRTGRMRSMIRLRSTGELVEVTSEAPYARFQHWGTRYVFADRHLTEPFKELEDVLLRDYEQLTMRFIDRVWVDNV